MAEQITHNVVKELESTSGSPLVDVAMNNTTLDSAARGTQLSLSSKDTADLSDSRSVAYADASIPSSNGLVDESGAKDAAEPSAGDAAHAVAQDLTHKVALEDQEMLSNGDLVNGIRDDISLSDLPADDRSTADLSVDVSVNSDTDNSKADAAEKKDGNHHVRTNSVKKPTTFSKVTATKNFMNKIAPSAPVVVKVGDKPSLAAVAAVPAANKPRLIAKTGASLANLQKSRSGSVSTSGPDASKVWNKNRPVAPPPPKQFTDEELKQQYGIHLATRLQSDENGKESKWADIDDDEDDWAPDAVVWMDGTKSTVAPQDTATPPPLAPPTRQQTERKPAVTPLPPQPKPTEGIRPVLALKQRSGESMRILKPGAALIAGPPQHDGPETAAAGLEKSTLKTKSPAPPPTKSPWAAVPKVDSVSPINPPVQHAPPPRQLPPQDARSYDQAPPAPPAREIAADTFDRSWEKGEGGTRELFNSANGRYEPAPEGRRSSRQDSALRKPALLQRPSHNANGATSAEPSVSVQSRTSTQAESGWGRRRGSSVSQGSMPPHRRLSMNQRPDLAKTAEMRQDSLSTSNTPAEPVAATFAEQSPWDQQMALAPPPPQQQPQPPAAASDAEVTAVDAVPAEDPVKVQERVMREKRELAVKRRKEEEQREEAAKQERLKAKLAALQGAGKSKKEREAEAAAAAAAKEKEPSASPDKAVAPLAPLTAQPPLAHSVEPVTTAASPPTLVEDAQAQAQAQAHSGEAMPDRVPPASLASSETKLPPQQQTSSQPQATTQPAAGLPERAVSVEQVQRQAPRTHLSPRATARLPAYQQQQNSYKAPASSYSSPGDRKPQPAFGRSPNLSNDAFTPWPLASGGSVWGTSGIGNGTFESSGTFAPVPMSQQSSSLPPPPGMARQSGSARISPQSFGQETRSPNLQQQPSSEQQRAFPPPTIDTRADAFSNQSRLNGMSPAPGANRPVHPPGPIGPPSRAQQQHQPSVQQPSARSDAISAWNRAAATLPDQYEKDVANANERRLQLAEMPPKPSEHRYRETFKKSSAGPLGAPRKYEKAEYTVHDASGSHSVASHSPAPPQTPTPPPAPFATANVGQDPWKISGEKHVPVPNSSRNTAHDGETHHRQPPIGPPHLQQSPISTYQSNITAVTSPASLIVGSQDPSPPPPETANHPVNDGDSHPHVKLPRPQAKVRLPPLSPTAQAQPSTQQHGSVLMPQRPWSNSGPPGAAKPIVMNAAWQARFNGLFNRVPTQTETPPSPPKTPPKMQAQALAVAPSSRISMSEKASGATVALPQAAKRISVEGFILDYSSDHFSKPIIDEMFKQEQSFGSTPKVRVPPSSAYNPLDFPPTTKNMLQLHVHSRFQKSIESQTSQEPFFWRNPDGIFVTIPNTKFRNKLFKTPGVSGKPTTSDARQSHMRANNTAANPHDRTQDRKPHGRNSRNKTGTESTTSDAVAQSTADRSRRMGNDKPLRQPTAASKEDDARVATAGPDKSDNMNEKRKSGLNGRVGRGHRGGRTNQATSSPTTVKSN